jgi:magnesium chelatase accessory protein
MMSEPATVARTHAHDPRMTATDDDGRLSWDRDGATWPHRETSRFVAAAGIRWHVQLMGSGPPLLLLHGTGASTHSWRGLSPLLATQFTVIQPDLPGHGFTQTLPRASMSLTGMATATAALLGVLAVTPTFVLGHSAGAAILARMALDGRLTPRATISLNGALLPLGGPAGHFFAPLAKLLAQSSLWPRLFAWRAGDPGFIDRLLRDTGSRLDASGVAFYRRLARSQAHVAAALDMMANWNLRALARDLPALRTPLTLIAATNDGTIPSADAYRVRALVPHSRVVRLPGLGHLAHEERPDVVAQLIRDIADGSTPA